MTLKKSPSEIELDHLVLEIESAGTIKKPTNRKNVARRKRKAKAARRIATSNEHGFRSVKSKCALCNATSAANGGRLYYCAGCRNIRLCNN
jgi:hypothetical protein